MLKSKYKTVLAIGTVLLLTAPLGCEDDGDDAKSEDSSDPKDETLGEDDANSDGDVDGDVEDIFRSFRTNPRVSHQRLQELQTLRQR